jgi:gamma-glutamyltranspeptidase/glutathione hydrolase
MGGLNLEEERMRLSRPAPPATALFATALLVAFCHPQAWAAQPVRAKNGMVTSQSFIASQVGADVLWDGGNAVDAAIATAFALAVVHPTAGNIGGGGFLISRLASGTSTAYDFREMAPALAHPQMFLKDGKYDTDLHHNSHLAVGIPGTVAGLHAAWLGQGSQKVSWRRLVEPAVVLAREGFIVTDGLARSLKGVLPRMQKYPASVAQFSRKGVPYEMGDILRQPELADTLERIAQSGPRGFYEGQTARLIAKEMKANGGLITEADLKGYAVKQRTALTGKYRGYDVIGMPPISSGGTALIEMLNVLEGYDLAADGPRSATTIHRIAESMRRAFADRARHIGDPEFNKAMPIARLTSKDYALELRKTIREDRASVSTPTTFEWPAESNETTHLSVVDRDLNAVSLTYTLEDGYGSKIVVPGAGFLLNNEMGDFNAGPGLTDDKGLVGTEPNLARAGNRMLSSMTPAILAKDGDLFMVLGSPGGRTIINTVLLTILNIVDFGMNIQDAIDFPRFHHQWLPDRIQFEKNGISPDTLAILKQRGHTTAEGQGWQGVVQGVVWNKADKMLEGGSDRRALDGAAIGR